MRVLRHWHRLPREVMDAPSLEVFKAGGSQVLLRVGQVAGHKTTRKIQPIHTTSLNKARPLKEALDFRAPGDVQRFARRSGWVHAQHPHGEQTFADRGTSPQECDLQVDCAISGKLSKRAKNLPEMKVVPHHTLCRDRRRSNGFKLKEGRFRLDIGNKCFTLRVVRHWPRFPREVGDAPSLEIFKVRFDGALSNLLWLKMSLLIAWAQCKAGSWAEAAASPGVQLRCIHARALHNINRYLQSHRQELSLPLPHQISPEAAEQHAPTSWPRSIPSKPEEEAAVDRAQQPQVPQPLPISLVLQTLPQLRCPSLDTLQPLHVSLGVRGPTLNTALEMQPHQCQLQANILFQILLCQGKRLKLLAILRPISRATPVNPPLPTMAPTGWISPGCGEAGRGLAQSKPATRRIQAMRQGEEHTSTTHTSPNFQF
ncbi:hypothetical protein QYF61_021537 [Mycteria americana]|uniref:Uncharacterized protein n=1 Tax=Mycteria americana TaxID=33587 RepID=A0AAN7NZV3_MYCAM|nr:hypothetical protein QYF61_021537 [Mycteria americana]